MSKLKILFVQESLTLAGGEKSLIALLSNLDPDKYEIDLQLFRFGGALDQFIPDYVNILPPMAYTEFLKKSLLKSIFSIFNSQSRKFLKARLKYSNALRKGELNHPEKAQLYWENVGPVFKVTEKKYDVAIAYAQGVPTFYVADKVKAKKKIAWVNANVIFPGKNKIFQETYYNKFEFIIPVSEVTHRHFSKLFPPLTSKLYTIVDIVDYRSIVKMSELKEISFQKDKFVLLTVSRLNNKMKGIDIAAETCKVLKERGINFHWYILGEGDYRTELELYIQENKLDNHLTLLGADPNPYPYFKAVDLYVQTSRSESYGIAIAEARLLNTPIVTTRFDTVFEQMIHEQNGLVVDMNAKAVADGIERMMKDKDLYEHIVAYLKQEQKEDLSSVDKFDEMVSL